LVVFGSGSTFAQVAHRYFTGRVPLTQGGACIAALYRAGATDRFGPAYEERHTPDQRDAGGRTIAAFLLNPVALYFWIRHSGLASERRLTNRGGVDYEIAVLSDHGQVETTPFSAKHGRSLGSYLSEWLPDHVITEHRGQVFAGNGQARGRVEVTYSGGLAHIYFADLPGRLDAGAVESRYPGLISRVARLDGIGLVMLKDAGDGM